MARVRRRLAGAVKTPTAESYWAVDGAVLAGKYPGAKADAEARAKIADLLAGGVKTFVDLTEDGELLPYAHLLPADATHHRIAVRDVTCPSREQVREALELIDAGRSCGVVYVHCRGGCGRTGVIIGAYLVRHGALPAQALERVRELTRALWTKPCPETPAQIAMIESWSEEDTGDLRDRVRGCLLGGALGDALGAPVEFLSLGEIRRRYGENGIGEFDTAYGRRGAITDDTQMTLFTAEGLLRAHNRYLGKGIASIPDCVWHAYLRWLLTQGETSAAVERFRSGEQAWPDGWLVTVDALHDRRAPGNTCLSALRGRESGSLERPPNGSKGCGAVMRAAPVGLMALNAPFQAGAEIGVLTHGHPSGYLTAGYLAELIAGLVGRESLESATARARRELETWEGAGETLAALDAAEGLARTGAPTAEKVASLGEGWVAEEALAIAVYCAGIADDFRHGVTLAVNHGGDSDSTGAITGNILGALLGEQALPVAWLEQLELREEITRIADDIVAHHGEYEAAGWDVEIPDWDRYPGW